LNRRLKEARIRVKVDDRREKMGYKIRDAETQKIPLILIVGDKELEQNNISVRVHTVGDKGKMDVDEFLAKIKELINNKSMKIDL
jgi:threonyl-tRNA synthetase